MSIQTFFSFPGIVGLDEAGIVSAAGETAGNPPAGAEDSGS